MRQSAAKFFKICQFVKYRFEKLTIHHIDYNKKNNDELNLISLCRKCHSKTGGKRKYWQNYFKEKVQRL
uniref:Putative homing endonuclease n=2 Tax=viral metagenome TaxID=1070528 RepID=A0A6H1ZX55_9ZZZZ